MKKKESAKKHPPVRHCDIFVTRYAFTIPIQLPYKIFKLYSKFLLFCIKMKFQKSKNQVKVIT
jgi:hypothetical protein